MHTIDHSKLRELRRRAGLNQAQTAELVGTHAKNVSHYENGRAKPSADGILNYLIAFEAEAKDIAKKI